MDDSLCSGDVPRELIPGIVWCEKAEAEFVERTKAFLRTSPLPASDALKECAMREARWAVEIRLHQRFTKARVQEADRCFSPADKRQLVTQWKKLYGEKRAFALVDIVKSDRLKAKVLEAW